MSEFCAREQSDLCWKIKHFIQQLPFSTPQKRLINNNKNNIIFEV